MGGKAKQTTTTRTRTRKTGGTTGYKKCPNCGGDGRVRVSRAAQRGHAEADGLEVRALVEQRLDVVVRGREGGCVHLHAGRADHQGVDVVPVELPALARLKRREKVRQLVADAVRKGAKHIIVGLGGSATSDAGIGMIRALVDSFAKNGTWDDIKELNNIHFTIASDVKNPLCGENGAAHVFGPQKGANQEDVVALDNRARRFAEASAKHFGFDRSKMKGAGAAGGLGYAFLQYLDAECKSGIQLLLETIHFDEMVKDAALVITGEGSSDRQTLMGKLPVGILEQSDNAPVCLIAGKISDREQLLKAGFAYVECINPAGITLEEAMRKEVAMQNIRVTVARIMNNCTKNSNC